jgi:hypothetical protein
MKVCTERRVIMLATATLKQVLTSPRYGKSEIQMTVSETKTEHYQRKEIPFWYGKCFRTVPFMLLQPFLF